MTCPHCKTEITTVYVYSTCHKKAWTNPDGKIFEYEQPEPRGDHRYWVSSMSEKYQRGFHE